jgi:hypothetical protein
MHKYSNNLYIKEMSISLNTSVSYIEDIFLIKSIRCIVSNVMLMECDVMLILYYVTLCYVMLLGYVMLCYVMLCC